MVKRLEEDLDWVLMQILPLYSEYYGCLRFFDFFILTFIRYISASGWARCTATPWRSLTLSPWPTSLKAFTKTSRQRTSLPLKLHCEWHNC